MKPFYSIAIPKPCRENWNAMTPNEKGRFCNSCSKTVIDFTKMNTSEIQDILHEHRGNQICGHIRQEQLDAINILIPVESISVGMNFHRLFLLALLIAMGTTLLNCTDANDKVQKIQMVEIVDTVPSKIAEKKQIGSDSIIKEAPAPEPIIPVPFPVMEPIGLLIATEGDVIIKETGLEIDSIAPLSVEAPVKGDLVVGGINFSIDSPPEFKDMPKQLSTEEKQGYFRDEINKFVQSNFRTAQGDLNVIGLQRISTRFTIDASGKVTDIEVRASDPSLEKEAKRVLNRLPQFIPAKHRSQNVKFSYSLPILINMEN